MKRKIVKVIVKDPANTEIILDDGSVLDGVTSVSAIASVNAISEVTLTAYVVPQKAGVMVKHTPEEEVSRFFSNIDY